MHHQEFTWLGWFFAFINSTNVHVFYAIVVALLITLAAIVYRKSLKSGEDEIIPDERISLKNFFQTTVEGVLSLMESIIGPDAKHYVPLIGSVFIYVLVSNLLGSIPGFVSPTRNVNTNFGISITVFFYYNYLGIKHQGLKNYLKHFMGPVAFIAPLLFAIELISHIVRPITLAVRLAGNLTGDHIVLGIFSDLVPVVVPVIFMAFGIFVAFVQAFVFTLLSTVYIGLAVAHEEH